MTTIEVKMHLIENINGRGLGLGLEKKKKRCYFIDFQHHELAISTATQ